MMAHKILSVLLLVSISISAYGNPPLDSLDVNRMMEMSLEDLLKLEVSIASKKSLTTRESPGIVSVISGQEIRNMGARDLIDVLRMLPGIQFGYDVQGVIGMGIRGNWGHEGKILLLLDGLEMNELMYSTNYFGNRFDITNIVRIEVIRGPGSSIYGGNAELGVINIITKSGADYQGIEAGANTGIAADEAGTAMSRITGSLGGGYQNNNNTLNVSAHVYAGQGMRTQIPYIDAYGTTHNTQNNSQIYPVNSNIAILYKGLKFRNFYETYQYNTIPYYVEAAATPARLAFDNWSTELKYELKINDKLTLTPKINTSIQKPWHIDKPTQHYEISNDSATGKYAVGSNILSYTALYRVQAYRYAGGIHANYDINPNINVIAGVEAFTEGAHKKDTVFFINQNNNISFNTISAYTQALIFTKFVNITGGLRYTLHNVFGSAIAPRIGFTQVLGPVHIKLLYSRAFRAPSMENINLNPNIKPEETDVAELELGSKLSSYLFITGNFYYINIYKPIIYGVTGNNEEAYYNATKTGSIGTEVELKFQKKYYNFTLNYSNNFAPAGINEVEDYKVPDVKDINLAFPTHKVSLYSSFRLMDNLYINPSVNIYSERYSLGLFIDTTGAAEVIKYPKLAQINVNISYSNIFKVKGLDVHLGMYDLGNANINFIQPYMGNAMPVPSIGREIILRAIYKFSKS
ncbi:MAG: TonB-dependent receptor [Cytophagales bacterium]|nr:TonB-dependent receptor [Cytophagales bacterium]